ncbi:hypothetical protein AgCh_012745 [Apium graveolens]
MEDVAATMPQFLEVPKKMILGEHVINGIRQNAGLITTHFFGVYDGHGVLRVLVQCMDEEYCLYQKAAGGHELSKSTRNAGGRVACGTVILIDVPVYLRSIQFNGKTMRLPITISSERHLRNAEKSF